MKIGHCKLVILFCFMKKPKITVIVGPTASGKTDYAIALAKKTGGEIISADSRQIYTGMNIGTAKPQGAFSRQAHDVLQADMVDGIPHFLFNVTSPDKPWTLPQWQAAANLVLEDIIKRGKQPILVGGTMLYVDSIVKNFSIPAVEPDMALRNLLEQKNISDLYQDLGQVDPDAREFIEPHHKHRMIRAMEVIIKTGKPFSASRKRQPSPYAFEITGLFPHQSGGQASWDIMKERISARAKQMFDAPSPDKGRLGGVATNTTTPSNSPLSGREPATNLVTETAALRDKYGKDLPLLKTMNYKQAGELLDGKATPVSALEDTIRVNIKYAKRQMAWWKGRAEITWK